MSLINTRDLLRIVYHKRDNMFVFSFKSHSKKACTFSAINAWEYMGDLSGMNYHHRTFEYFMYSETCLGFKDNENTISTHVYLPDFINDAGGFDVEEIIKYIDVHFKVDGKYDLTVPEKELELLRKNILSYGNSYCHRCIDWLRASEVVINRINRDHVNLDDCSCLFDCMCVWERYKSDKEKNA